MRVSEAIALGRTTIPKLISGDLEACALGMAANAVGCQRKYDALSHVWPWLYSGKSFRCPECEDRVDNGMNTISHLFDHHVMWDGTKEFTLDQLIDWVRSVEPPELEETSDGDRAETVAATEGLKFQSQEAGE